MRIIEPSATIIEDELSRLSVYQRIDRCTSVCYQRPPKPTEEEAQAFCKKLFDMGHLAALEMAVVHLVVDPFEWLPVSKFMLATPIDESAVLVSGSIRAMKESIDTEGSTILKFLAEQYPLFYLRDSALYGGYTRFAGTHEIPWQHKHVAVRFIVNRAVSHELVRHRPASYLQESQRYCRYEDEVVFVKPEWFVGGDLTARVLWETHVEDAERRYKMLLKQGLKPQQARAVLPNSTKTEIICYASLSQWKHMFNLRCAPAADPEMRRVMIPLYESFLTKYPEAFV